MSTTASHATPAAATSTAPARHRPADFLWLTTAIAVTVFVGFWFTYFGPMLARAYPPASPMVHLHGWSFFAWYLLLPIQAVFRIVMVVAGPMDWVVPASILLTNLFIVAGMVMDGVRDGRVHREYAIGLATCVLLEGLVYFTTPTPAGRPLALALGWIGGTFGGLY